VEGRLPVRPLSGDALGTGRRWWAARPSRRAALGGALFLVALAAALRARVLWVRRAVDRDAAQQLARVVEVTRPIIDAWRDAYVSHAALAARLAALEPALGAAAGRVPNESSARLGAVLGALGGERGVVGAWVYDAAGRPVAGAPDLASAPAAPSGAGREPAVRTGLDAGGVHADVLAPVSSPADREGPPLGTVRVRVRVTDATFAALNPPRPGGPSARTTIVARVGDSALVIAAGADARGRAGARALPLRAVPPHVRAALEGRSARGVGPGLLGTQVVYGAAAVRSIGWALVREEPTDELYAAVRPAVIVEETIFAALAILLAATILAVVRGARARRAAALAELRGDFVSAVSHELRTPLAQIRLFAELLRKGSLRDAAEADRALGVIEKEAGRLSILVDNVLSYTSLRRRQRFVTPLAADVAAEARQVIESFAPLAAERGVRVVAELEEGARARVDTQALRQVLLNFLENAVKYGPKGQTVTVGARHVVAPNGADRVRLWVDDEGPGVTPAERAAVWDPFYRTERARRSGVGGSGLGLAVVRDLVAHHGGTTAVEDAPSGGARFVAELPGLRVS
jgi:signal transduction histidine kinase